jgi:hypothetical protein
MTERWQREVRKLGAVEPERDAWKRATTRAPGGDGLPPPRQRIVAGVVAFGVFFAAASFGWLALRPAAERTPGGGTDGTEALVTLRVGTEGSDTYPIATLKVDGVIHEGQAAPGNVWDLEGTPIPWLEGEPPFRSRDHVTIELPATLELAGDADGADAILHDPKSTFWADAEGDVIGPLGSPLAFEAPPGRYVLEVLGHWRDHGDPSFYFPIELVEAPSESVEPQKEDPATYIFSDVVAGPSTAEPDELAVSFTVSWSGQEYPGVHLCTYRAMATDGTVIGEFVHLAAWQPGRWHREIPGDPGAAARGEVSCEPERLDDPGIADVRSIPRSDGTSLDEITAKREDRLEDWAARWAVDSMTESQLAGNLWAIWTAMTQSHDSDLTISWQLEDRRHYLCVRLPPEHEFRGGEFCD